MWSSISVQLFLVAVLLIHITDALRLTRNRISSKFHSTSSELAPAVRKQCGQISGQRWHELDDFKPLKVMGPVTVLKHLGDIQPIDDMENNSEEKRRYHQNVGKALDTLQRELPLVFYTTNLDFSVFSPFITVVDHKQHKISIKKSIYSAAVKSLRMASAISSMYPSMNVRKIEYIDSCRTIQCLVEIVLPDSVRIDGQSVWEGMMYFGLNSEGFIDTHIFDQKISNFTPEKPVQVSYPWLRSNGPEWKPELVAAMSGSDVKFDLTEVIASLEKESKLIKEEEAVNEIVL